MARSVSDIFNTAKNFQIYLNSLPYWSSHFSNYLLNNIPMNKAVKVIDVACGPGIPTIELAQRLGDGSEVIGVDKWSDAINHSNSVVRSLCLKNISFFEADVCKLPFEDNLFTTAVSVLGISNFDAPENAMKEVRRVLQPEGTLHITTNLVGHMEEFYIVFEKILLEMGMESSLTKLKAHIAHRPTILNLEKLFKQSGFILKLVEESAFKMVFANGSSFLNSEFIKFGFMPSWRDIVEQEDEKDQVFNVIESKLNKISDNSGALWLTIPMAYLEAKKDGE